MRILLSGQHLTFIFSESTLRVPLVPEGQESALGAHVRVRAPALAF